MLQKVTKYEMLQKVTNLQSVTKGN